VQKQCATHQRQDQWHLDVYVTFCNGTCVNNSYVCCIANCQKTSILVESAVSVISITNCQSFQLQVTGSAPTIQIETTDSGQVFLSRDCLGVEIITAKCSAINISIPSGEDGDFVEKPVPEMLRSVIQDGKLITSIVEHTG
jgi:adenylyl cyclase-associated protein